MANNFFNNSYLILLLIVSLIFISIPFQKNIDKERSKFITIKETIRLSPKVLKVMSLGYDEIVADIYWFRALQYFGNRDIQKKIKKPEVVYKYFDIITELDPKFVNAYRFGGMFLSDPLPLGFNRLDLGTLLYDKGRKHNPDNFRIPLEQGFQYYFYSDDKNKSAELFMEASEKPGLTENRKSSFKGMSASALRDGGNNDLAIIIWEDIYNNSTSEARKKFALLNIKELNTRKLENTLTEFANLYEKVYGNFPSDINDLLILNEVKKLPKDHEDQDFYIDQENKSVKSPTLNKQLLTSI